MGVVWCWHNNAFDLHFFCCPIRATQPIWMVLWEMGQMHGAWHMVGVHQWWALLSLCKIFQGKRWLEFVSKPFVLTLMIVWHLSSLPVEHLRMFCVVASSVDEPWATSPQEFAELHGEECESSPLYLFPVLTGSYSRQVEYPDQKVLMQCFGELVKCRFWSCKSEIEPNIPHTWLLGDANTASP